MACLLTIFPETSVFALYLKVFLFLYLLIILMD
jgi:hypothetical protein